MRRRTLYSAVAALLVSATLSAQSPAVKTSVPASQSDAKDALRLRRLKQRATDFNPWRPARVKLANGSNIKGLISDVSNEGIWLIPRMTYGKSSKSPVTSPLPSRRFISFSEIREITSDPQDENNAFGIGVICGLMGPLGWIAAWAMATGND
jgi:hypothetical protein